ncbi:hypothetical protein [Streptomyces ziwulingensis]|uniref:Uncharacterized protein n=1 Tax=Streptomyces ziwulingensis TaxID=1045501 RepID=A0ABP9D4N5_9ACTN
MRQIRFAWCFDHGTMHHFPVGPNGDEPWCTAAWVAFTATTADEAADAKHAAYGDARFLDDLPTDKLLEVIEIGEARR